jgi:hypothetical protein
MLLHINGKFAMRKLKLSLLSVVVIPRVPIDYVDTIISKVLRRHLDFIYCYGISVLQMTTDKFGLL